MPDADLILKTALSPESGWESMSILFPLIWDATTIWS